MKQLILCERPFMLYKAILKALTQNDTIDIVLSNHMPGLEKMYQPLVESGFFAHVYYFDDVPYQDYIRDEQLADYVKFPNILWAWPKKLARYFKYQKLARKASVPEGLDLHSYDEILANDGVSTMNFKLNFEKIPYVVSEHGRGNFKNKYPLHILAVYISIVLDYFNIIVAYSASSKYVKEVEVDRNEDLVCYIKNRKKVRECRVNDFEAALTEEEKDKIYGLYAKAYDLPEKYDEEVNLLLTGPLANYGVLNSVEDQLQCYTDAVNQYCDTSKRLIIKPHPRDDVDYTECFPNAVIINPIVSSEVLSFCSTLKIDKVITIYSTSVSSFRRARDMIVLGDSFLDGYHRIANIGQAITSKEDLHRETDREETHKTCTVRERKEG